MPSLWFRLVLFNSKKKKEDLEMLQYNFTKGQKETLQNWSAFRLSVVKPKLYIEPMGTQNQPNRLKYGKTRAPKS